MDMDISPDSKTKNEIYHLLINDMRIGENVECLPSFKFPFDHQIIRSSLKIQRRTRYENYKENLLQKQGRIIIPKNNKKEANRYVEKQMERRGEYEKKDNLQELYNKIEKVIFEMKEIKTDDKLTEKTKGTMERRNKLLFKIYKTTRERIEVSELHKVARRGIRKDIKTFDENRIREVIEEKKSTRKMWKEMSEGHSLITKIGDKRARNKIWR